MKKHGLGILLFVFSIFALLSNGVWAAETPQYGGVFRIIYTYGPKVMSYVPEMGPGDHAAVFPAGKAS